MVFNSINDFLGAGGYARIVCEDQLVLLVCLNAASAWHIVSFWYLLLFFIRPTPGCASNVYALILCRSTKGLRTVTSAAIYCNDHFIEH